MEENPKIPKIQHSKRVKAVAIGLMDHITLEVAISEEDEGARKVTKKVSSSLIVKSMVIWQESVVPIRKNLKKIKL